MMLVATQNIVSITEANQNFSKVARLAERAGEVVIFKNNKPKFRLVDLDAKPEIEMSDTEKFEFVARRVLKRYHAAFEALAK